MSVGAQLKEMATGPKAPWIMGGLGLTAVYLWWSRASPVPAEDDDTTLSTGDIERIPAGSAAGSDLPDAPSKDPLTNDEWGVRAIEWLTARLFSASFAQTAISKALAGEALTVAEQSAVGLAMSGLGPPPQGMPPVGAAPLPGNPTPPPWKGPLVRKAADGPTLRSINTLPGGKRTWAQLLSMFYTNLPPDMTRINLAAAQLRAANTWRGRADGSGMWQSVSGNKTVTVPKYLL